MNASVFVVLFAVAYSVSADCGCLKCSKDLTVAGQSLAGPDCGPAQIIYRGSAGAYPGHQLSATVQAPGPAVAANTAAEQDLSYKVLPSTTVTEFVERPLGFRQEYKIQAPLAPALPAVSLPATNLKSCVDRVVLPGPAPVVEYAAGETIVNPVGATSTIISEGFAPMHGSRGWMNRGGCGYNREIDIITPAAGPALLPAAGSALVSSAGPAIVTAGPVVEKFVGTGYNAGLSGLSGLAGYNSGLAGYNSGFAYNTGCGKGPMWRRPIAPAVDVISNRCETRKAFYRYRNELIPTEPTRFALSLNNENINKNIANVNINNHCTASTNNSNVIALDVNDRKKREIPFLKHGYKFLMNMLPDFVQEPIRKSVNNFALTHPDKKLPTLYNQPKLLSLGDKILLQNKKNMNLLKRKLLGHHVIKKPSVNDYLIEKEARAFSSKLTEPIKYPKHPWLNEIHPRFLNIEQNLNSELVPTKKTRLSFDDHLIISKEFANPEDKSQLTEFQKVLFLKKLKKLNEEDKVRNKRSTSFQDYMNAFTQDPQNHVILGSDELSLPFYQVKMDDSCEESQFDAYYDHDDGGVASREQMLRNIIRKGLRRYKYKQSNEEEERVSQPFNNIVPHSPLFHLITLPIRLLQNFDQFSKQAFPVVSSVPQMITTSKKYFKDFGRNFKKNMLHLASDVIGDFDNLNSRNDVLANIIDPLRRKRSIYQTNEAKLTDTNELQKEERKLEQYEPDYSLEFGKTKKIKAESEEKSEKNLEPDYSLGSEYDTNENVPNVLDAKIRNKRYILKMVDEDEVEDYLVEKLGKFFSQTEERHPRKERVKASQYSGNDCPTCQLLRQSRQMTSGESYGQKKVVLEQLKPKIIVDNNGLPFLELGGYKKPMLKSVRKNRRKQSKTQDSFESPQNPYYYSGEVDSEKIGYLIDHARDHVESSYNGRFSEMPVKTVKEKISQLLLETDFLVHMDFDQYDEIFDNLITLQHIKSGVEQDWKRLIISKRIDDMNSKISLLGKFQEMQHFKDMTLREIAHVLNEETENKFITKKLLKILVRLQKLQCIINQVVENVQAKLHMGSKCDTRKEIKYVDFFTGLNFVNAKTRNEMISNLKKDRDLALQQNIELLDQLKRLLACDGDSETLNEEASLLWEMRNIEKLQISAIEDMNQRLNDGYKIKKELKILFDLLKRYETCEAEQRKLLSQSEESSSEENSEEYSEEDANTTRNKKESPRKKFDIEEFRSRLQERLRKRKMLLRKKLRNGRTNRKSKAESCESDEDE